MSSSSAVGTKKKTVIRPGETTPLLFGNADDDIHPNNNNNDDAVLASTTTTSSYYNIVWDFLDSKTFGGKIYEKFMIILILINVIAFIIGTLFVIDDSEESNNNDDEETLTCGTICDTIWFGNYENNKLAFLNIGTTSVLELFTIGIFTVEYVLRVWTSPLENQDLYGKHIILGRIKYIFTNFFSLVDLSSTIPFYVDVFLFTSSTNAFGTTSYLRMFRLFRLMGRVDGVGRYDSALTLCDDVYRAQKAILGTAAFVGVTTWIVISTLYYIVERTNLDMIYCPNNYCIKNLLEDGDGHDDDDIDTSLCTIDNWGIVDCSAAGCPSTLELPQPCWNLYQSIPMASYYTLLNLFGEFPLFDQHSVGGQIIGTITAVMAVTFFALPVGIIGNGFETEISKRRRRKNNNNNNNNNDGPIIERGVYTIGYIAPTTYNTTYRSKLYNFLFPMTSSVARIFDTYFINMLVIGTAITYMIDTIDILPEGYRIFQSYFELFAVLIFTMEYILKFIACVTIDPMYNTNNSNPNPNPNGGYSLWSYVTGFLPMVDLLGFLPYWIVLFGFSGNGTSILDISGPSDIGSTFVKALRLLRIFRFEKYTHAFTSFDDVFTRNYDVLSVTFFSSLLLWVLFSSILYITERNNPDNEMSSNYNNMPNSMWMTLLNLSGEAPLAQYSVWGKFATGILGLFA
jgi:hypothetical protein